MVEEFPGIFSLAEADVDTDMDGTSTQSCSVELEVCVWVEMNLAEEEESFTFSEYFPVFECVVGGGLIEPSLDIALFLFTEEPAAVLEAVDDSVVVVVVTVGFSLFLGLLVERRNGNNLLSKDLSEIKSILLHLHFEQAKVTC